MQYVSHLKECAGWWEHDARKSESHPRECEAGQLRWNDELAARSDTEAEFEWEWE